MSKTGPIIIVEDDLDDHFLLEKIFQELGTSNERIYFRQTAPAFTYLKSNDVIPFLILCDINLPTQSGLEFKKEMDLEPMLRKKSIPFVFLSTAATKQVVTEAYLELTIQGFFQKAYEYDEMKDTLKLLIDYWKVCKHPNSQ